MECAIRGMATMSLGATATSAVRLSAVRVPQKTFLAATTTSRSCRALSSASSSLFLAAPLPVVAAAAAPKAAKAGPVQVVAKTGYKLKTHKASAKRFRVTGSGKVVRRNAWRAHLLAKKSTKRKNRLAGMSEVFRGDIDKIVGAMPYLKVKRFSRLPRRQAPAVEAPAVDAPAEQSE